MIFLYISFIVLAWFSFFHDLLKGFSCYGHTFINLFFLTLEGFLLLCDLYSLVDLSLFLLLLYIAFECFLILGDRYSLVDRRLFKLIIDTTPTKTCAAATLHEKAHATNVRGVENGPGKKKALGVNPKTMMERLGTFWDPDDQREALDMDETVNFFVEDEPSLEKQKGKLELGATRIAKANVCLSGYNNSKDRLLPRESRMESENGGLKPTVVVANKDGNMKDGKEGKLEDVKSNQGTDEGLVKKSSRKNSSNKGSMSRPKEWQPLEISLKEIEVATKNFQDCIGKGGYGLVYKGKLYKSGRSVLVAIKRLNTQFGQGLKEFLTEIHLLSGTKHPNLISLLGYCEEDKEKILVYEYAQRGSLDQYLRRNNTTNYTLTWLQRLKICVGVARGLDHIHYHVGKHLAIIHRDLKSANILLDQNLVAKISDFGLSKLSFAGLDNSTVISNVCGTPGYCEPEYMITGMVKKESDVYSFGMVLFEVLCGRLCTVKDNDDILLSGPLIREFYEKKRLEEIIDPSLKEHFNSDSMNKFSEIAYRCLHSDRTQRPPMDVVLKELEDLLKPEV